MPEISLKVHEDSERLRFSALQSTVRRRESGSRRQESVERLTVIFPGFTGIDLNYTSIQNGFSGLKKICIIGAEVWGSFSPGGSKSLEKVVFIGCRFDGASLGGVGESVAICIENNADSADFIAAEREKGIKTRDLTIETVFSELRDIDIPLEEKVQILGDFGERQKTEKQKVKSLGYILVHGQLLNELESNKRVIQAKHSEMCVQLI